MVTRNGRLGCSSCGGAGRRRAARSARNRSARPYAAPTAVSGKSSAKAPPAQRPTRVDRARAGDQRRGDRGEREVAGGAAEAIVEAAQVVEVDEQQRQRARVAAGAIELLAEAHAEVVPGERAGEAVARERVEVARLRAMMNERGADGVDQPLGVGGADRADEG